MEGISAFFVENIGYVYFFYGLAFFALGLVVLLEAGRPTEFRFGHALLPLALFGLIHGSHEWFEMFQIFAAKRGMAATGAPVELLRLILLVSSFLCLLNFGLHLLPGAEDNPATVWTLTAAIGGLTLVALGFVYLIYRPAAVDLLIAGDVLSRYLLAVPGAILATWALLRERHDFHARGMSRYGRGLLWAALAFLVYGVVGQLFVRPSIIPPSQFLNSDLFLQVAGFPVQLLRTIAALAIAVALGSALRAFEAENRIRLARANKGRLEALDAQARRAEEVEALNARLQVTARELSSLVELSRLLTSTVDLDRLTHDALHEVVVSMDGVCCSLLFLRQSGGSLEFAGMYRRPEAPQPDPPPPLEETARQAYLYESATGAGLDGEVGLLDDDSFAGGRMFRTLGLPLRSPDRIFGSMSLGSLHEAEPLGEEELSLFQAFTQQMAASIENALLYQRLAEREAQLEELVRQLMGAQEAERQRIARELHDETGQKLTALALGLAAVQGRLGTGDAAGGGKLVGDLRDVANQALMELRHIMSNLRPAQLDELGLAPTLRWYVEQYAERHPELDVQLALERLPRRLSSQAETILFRVVQEALTNVERHAHATTAKVSLTQGSGVVRLTVTDDGVGFDPALLPAASSAEAAGGWGLVGMRERAGLARGRFMVESRAGGGTTVCVELPAEQEHGS